MYDIKIKRGDVVDLTPTWEAHILCRGVVEKSRGFFVTKKQALAWANDYILSKIGL